MSLSTVVSFSGFTNLWFMLIEQHTEQLLDLNQSFAKTQALPHFWLASRPICCGWECASVRSREMSVTSLDEPNLNWFGGTQELRHDTGVLSAQHFSTCQPDGSPCASISCSLQQPGLIIYSDNLSLSVGAACCQLYGVRLKSFKTSLSLQPLHN